jgi:hypothetical protein
MHPDPRLVQPPDLIEQVEDSPIVNGIGDIEANDM